jgi:hypothetical protein
MGREDGLASGLHDKLNRWQRKLNSGVIRYGPLFSLRHIEIDADENPLPLQFQLIYCSDTHIAPFA